MPAELPQWRRSHAAPDFDTDFSAWTQAQAAAIRAKDVAALDIEHLAEEGQSLFI